MSVLVSWHNRVGRQYLNCQEIIQKGCCGVARVVTETVVS